MNKSMLSSLVLLAAVTLPTSAMALDVGKERNVFILHGQMDIPVGQWICDVGQYVDVSYDETSHWYGYEACRYLCKWVNNAYLPLSSNLYIDELITPGAADCDENSWNAVNTTILLAPGFLSKGFDRNNQKRIIVSLVQGEDGEHDGMNETSGTISFANGGLFNVYALETELAP